MTTAYLPRRLLASVASSTTLPSSAALSYGILTLRQINGLLFTVVLRANPRVRRCVLGSVVA